MIIQDFLDYGNSVNTSIKCSYHVLCENTRPTSFPDLISKTTRELVNAITTQQHHMTYLKLIFSIKLLDTFLPVSPKLKGQPYSNYTSRKPHIPLIWTTFFSAHEESSDLSFSFPWPRLNSKSQSGTGSPYSYVFVQYQCSLSTHLRGNSSLWTINTTLNYQQVKVAHITHYIKSHSTHKQ